jgi:hypothetical protein
MTVVEGVALLLAGIKRVWRRGYSGLLCSEQWTDPGLPHPLGPKATMQSLRGLETPFPLSTIPPFQDIAMPLSVILIRLYELDWKIYKLNTIQY